jgi:Leucine-rich repeat (LRR) protein
LVDAIAESRGIANARRLVAVHVAGEAEPLAGAQSVAGRMADAGASELFMLLRACDDRRVLEEIYNRGGGANWPRYACAGWMTDAPLSEWYGVTADADGNATALHLGGLEITTLSGIIALAEALPGLQLTTLHLRNNQITDVGAAALAQALPGSKVTMLNLDDNQITDEGVVALAEALPGSQVTALDLSCNQITDAGAVALAEALPGSLVTTLDLSSHQITDAGVEALAQALPGSQVTKLDLSNNQITDAGAAALAEALLGSQVTMLNLSSNSLITGVGAAALTEVTCAFVLQ